MGIRRVPGLWDDSAGGTVLSIEVGIIIVHWNSPERCTDTIRAFRSQGVPIRILVIDNGSTPENLAKLQLMCPDINIRQLGRNVGFGPGANCGISEMLQSTDLQLIALAPHDAIPERGCLNLLCAGLEGNPRAGAVCAEYGRGKTQHYSWMKSIYLTPSDNHSPGWNEALYPHGTLTLFRRLCLEQVGCFDERYFAYFEECDWGFRARAYGWQIGIIGGAVVRNPDRTAASPVVVYLNVRNSLILVRDHSGMLAAMIRSVVIALNTFVLWFRPRYRQTPHSTRVRLRAICDYWLGRLGSPPRFITNIKA
ncbi:MAG: glycosyl transferase [Planctomycetaceae bacterium]|nr:glycosyl transferase [Planctomycetaceae bacterium]